MMIKREDVMRMKSTAEQVAKAKSAFQIHTIEMDFVALMTEKYGKEKAVEMLTKVWNLASVMKVLPEDTNFELTGIEDV